VDRLHRRGPVFEQESLVELASIIATADVYVGNDAGPTHLAAALGRPTVAIFGPTPPSVWRPLGENIHVVCGNAPADDPFSGITVAQITNIVTGYSLAR
jgi:ADP-heptose:LPS heptosyltransferase